MFFRHLVKAIFSAVTEKGTSMGEVVSIHVVRRRDGAAEAVERAMVRTNYGLEGDWRSRWNRAGQLTLIESETLEEVGRLLGAPIPPGGSRRQVVVRGIQLNNLIGQRMRLGSLRVFVETPCDPCARMEATIGTGAEAILQGRGGVRCHVLVGGELRVGDPIIEEPFQEEILRKSSSVRTQAFEHDF